MGSTKIHSEKGLSLLQKNKLYIIVFDFVLSISLEL
jgi:hypothetical protein